MQQRYYIKFKTNTDGGAFSVRQFQLTEALDRYYRLELEVTHPQDDIALNGLIHQPVQFGLYMANALPEVKMAGIEAIPSSLLRQWHGVVLTAAHVGSSADESCYRLVVVPRVALLDQIAYTRLFQHETALTIVEKILRHHGLDSADFQLRSQRSLPRYEHRMQYRETDWAFMCRVLAQEGLWFHFEQTDTNEVLVVGDDLSHYVQTDSLQQLQLKPDAGLESTHQPALSKLAAELAFDVATPTQAAAAMMVAATAQPAITAFRVLCQAQYAGVKVKDYNYRDAQNALVGEAGFDEVPPATFGTPYLYGQFHHKDQQQASDYARIAHERSMALHLTASGDSTLEAMAPGYVFRFADEARIGATRQWLLTQVVHSGSRAGDYHNQFAAIDAAAQWRPAWLHYPVIEGTIAATVCDAGQGSYAWVDEMGRYIVQFNLDLDSWQPGGESRPVRLAKPYAGEVYGQHFPLHAGTEVQLAFQNGDPDRPYIVGVLHTDTVPEHVPNSWRTRNVIRTWANNKIRMEDQRGHEHIKVATEYHKTQLNLGHLVDGGRQQRGEGFELRTDGYGALRSAQALYLSTETQRRAGGEQLEHTMATQELADGLSQASALAGITAKHTRKAPQTAALQQLAEVGRDLSAPLILSSGVAGLAQVTPQTAFTSASVDIHQQAGQEVFVGAGQSITQTAVQSIQLVAQTNDLNLVAGKTTARLASHGADVEVLAATNINQYAVGGSIVISAKSGIKLASGGSYIEIKDGKISLYSAGPIEYKGNHQFEGPQGGTVPMPAVPNSVCLECLRKARAAGIGIQER